MDFSLEQVLSGDSTNHLLVTFAETPNNLNSEGMFHQGPVTKDSLHSLWGPIGRGPVHRGWWLDLPDLTRKESCCGTS